MHLHIYHKALTLECHHLSQSYNTMETAPIKNVFTGEEKKNFEENKVEPI